MKLSHVLISFLGLILLSFSCGKEEAATADPNNPPAMTDLELELVALEKLADLLPNTADANDLKKELTKQETKEQALGSNLKATDKDGYVTELNFKDQNLKGSIPSEIKNFKRLTKITFEGNKELTGDLPTESFKELTELTEVTFRNNGLFPNPDTFEKELKAKKPSITINFEPKIALMLEYVALKKLSKLIPNGVGNADDLRQELENQTVIGGKSKNELKTVDANSFVTVLDLSDKGLTGEIPPEIKHLKKLIKLHLDENELTGQIPSEIKHLTNLTGLYLDENELSGEIPKEIGKLENLTHLHLDENKLSGVIPSEIGDLKKLTHLYLYNNQLEDPLPIEAFKKLENLQELNISENENISKEQTDALKEDLKEQITAGLTIITD